MIEPERERELEPGRILRGVAAAKPVAVRAKIFVEIAAVQIDDDVRRRDDLLRAPRRARAASACRSRRPDSSTFIPLRSIGLTCGVIDWNDATLSSGATITVPASCFASMRAMSFCIAMIDVYSVPWLPETNATIGPGCAPRITATGIESAESVPAGTAIAPYAVVPGAAVAEPTVNGVVCWREQRDGARPGDAADAARRGMHGLLGRLGTYDDRDVDDRRWTLARRALDARAVAPECCRHPSGQN